MMKWIRQRLAAFRDFMARRFWTYPVARWAFGPLQWYVARIQPRVQDVISWSAYVRRKTCELSDVSVTQVSVFPTVLCNARCVFCAYPKARLDEAVSTMSMDVFGRVVQEAKDCGIRSLALMPTVGEPLIDPTLIEKIIAAHDAGFRVATITNGLLLRKNDIYRRLVDARVDELAVSISDVNPLIEARNFGVTEEQAVEKMEGIRALVGYNSAQHGIGYLCLSFRPSRNPFLVCREPVFQELTRGDCVYDFLLRLDNCGGVVTKKDVTGTMCITSPRRFKRYPCRALNHVNILPDGTVRRCGCRFAGSLRDDLVIGNIMEESLRAMMLSEHSLELRRRFWNGNWPRVCRECAFYNEHP